MPDLFDRRSVPLHDQIDCAVREVAKRRHVYARLVEAGKLTQAKADQEIAAMTAIAETLRHVARLEAPAPELRGTLPLVLYFATEQERMEFVNLVKTEKPNMVERKL